MKWQKIGNKRIVRGIIFQKDNYPVCVELLTWRDVFTRKFSSYAIVLFYKGNIYETCHEFFNRSDALKEIKSWTNESVLEYLEENYFLTKSKY